MQSNCKRKRKSTYTLDESVCGEQCVTKEERGEPPSKRVRRATFSVSPKIINKNEINNIDENTSANVEAHSAETLNGIMDVHSEIMDLLDKRVEEIRKLDRKNCAHMNNFHVLENCLTVKNLINLITPVLHACIKWFRLLKLLIAFTENLSFI